MISVIIPTYNKSALLKCAILSVLRQIYPKGKYELLVVDNNSNDDTFLMTNTLIQQFNNYNLRYIHEPIPGLLSARHRGIRESNGDILTFIDEDIVADKNWLAAIDKSFRDREVSLVTGKNLPNYESVPPDWINSLWIKNDYGKVMGELSLLDFGDNEIFISPRFVWGLNFSIRRSTIMELNGFHPDVMPSKLQRFQGDGETGLCVKAIRKGLKAKYNPKVLVYHFVSNERMTTQYFKKRYFYQGVADSYTIIRSKCYNNKYHIIDLFILMIHNNILTLMRLLNKFVTQCITKDKIFKKYSLVFWISYIKGYNFHNKSVRKNKKLFQWVIKENYWDYTLPKIN